MAQTPNQPPIDLVSVPSSTVGPNTQDTLPFQQQIENYNGPSLVHGNARSVHEIMSPNPGDVTGQATSQSTIQSQWGLYSEGDPFPPEYSFPDQYGHTRRNSKEGY
eukprot:2886575-Amphidinium_carterae.1